MTKILNPVTLQPEPSTELVRRIKQIDGRLSLKYMPPPGEGWWIICDWVENDPRRMMIRRGDMPESGAYDLVSFLPPDCPMEQVPAYIERGMRGNAREDIHRMCNQLDNFNRQQTEENWKPVVEEALNLVEVKGGRLFEGDGTGTVKVPQYTGPDPTAPTPAPPPAVPETATGAARRK